MCRHVAKIQLVFKSNKETMKISFILISNSLAINLYQNILQIHINISSEDILCIIHLKALRFMWSLYLKLFGFYLLIKSGFFNIFYFTRLA